MLISRKLILLDPFMSALYNMECGFSLRNNMTKNSVLQQSLFRGREFTGSEGVGHSWRDTEKFAALGSINKLRPLNKGMNKNKMIKKKKKNQDISSAY